MSPHASIPLAISQQVILIHVHFNLQATYLLIYIGECTNIHLCSNDYKDYEGCARIWAKHNQVHHYFNFVSTLSN